MCRNPVGVIPAKAGTQYASPHRGRGRPGRRQRRRPGRVRGPLCHSCASRNPGFFAPPPVSFLRPPVSFPRKQQSSPPLPLRERVASRPGWPGEGVPVSFPRKQESRLLCTAPRGTAAQAAVQNDAGFPRTRFLPSSTEAGTQQPALLLPQQRPIGRFLRLHCSPAANRTREIFGPW